MSYPNPLTVRTVKQVLKDGMYEAGLYGASSVVDALVGTFWGSLFTRSNRRDYLNFLGELAGRSITGQQARIASVVVSDHYMTSGADGKPVIHLPAKYDGSQYYNRDGGQRQVNRGYDPVPYSQRENIISSNLNMKGNRYNKNYQNKPKDNKLKTNNQGKQVQKKKDMSILEDAVNTLSRKSGDFSVADFFRKVKNKLLSLINSYGDKKQAGKDVLQGCYEFLEGEGLDGYSILVNILTSNQRNFSEDELGEETVNQFKDAVLLYSQLSDDQKQAFYSSLNASCGKEGSQLMTSALQNKSDGITIPASVIKMLKVLGILTIAVGVLRLAFIPPKQSEGLPII